MRIKKFKIKVYNYGTKGSGNVLEIKLGKRIAQNIRVILAKKRMNLADFAKKMGHSRSSTSDFLENLEKGSATLKTICKYASALEVDPDDLFKELELKPKGE